MQLDGNLLAMTDYLGSYPMPVSLVVPFYGITGFGQWSSHHHAIPNGNLNGWTDYNYPTNTGYSINRQMMLLYAIAAWAKIFHLDPKAPYYVASEIILDAGFIRLPNG